MEEKTATNAWLMWVGSNSYSKIEDWASEAVTQGISKRLPSIGTGKALMAPNTLIFVAHDEGETHDCPACPGMVECPECRKRLSEIDRVNKEISALLLPYGEPEKLLEIGPQGAKRSYRLRMERCEQLNRDMANCDICKGALLAEGATGGYVLLNSGSRMDYRQYSYWLHQPGKFDKATVAEKHMCENCGGTGKIPNAKVFGLFIPERIEYIVEGSEDESELEKVRDFTKVTKGALVLEKERKCGYRKPRGCYAVTSAEGTGAAAVAVEKLVKSGLIEPDAVEVFGNFIRFVNPVPVSEKRFRGIAHFEPSPELDSMAADILEALS